MDMIKVRLSIMMVLQYAVWGAWLPLAGRYLSAAPDAGGLGFDGAQIGMILGLAASIGAISAPFIAGQVADRYFNTERFLAFLLICGGVCMWALSMQTSYNAFLMLSILYSVIYMPTLSLSNSMAFANLKDAKKEFPLVRVWGGIGWIGAGWIFSLWLVEPENATPEQLADITSRIADAFKFSALISVFYALYCLTLPAVPPKRDAVEKIAVTKAFGLLQHPSFLLLVVASLAIAMIHQIYFIGTPSFLSEVGLSDANIPRAMSVGQVAELLIMATMGVVLATIGFRWIIAIGALAYFLRYAIWANHTEFPVEVIVGSQALHGFCYAYFFASAFIYVDKLASEDIRNSAQTVFGIVILGGGPILGGQFYGILSGWAATEAGGVDWSYFWYVCAGIGLAVAVVFALFFRDETPPTSDTVSDMPQVE